MSTLLLALFLGVVVAALVAPQAPPRVHGDGHPGPGVAGNERLTALAGAVLLALFAVEVTTVQRVRALMPVHVVVGTLLAGPLVVKIGSTGWRFIRYYTNSPACRRKGPPHPLQRTLSPLLLIATIILVASGFGLATTRPGTHGVLFVMHRISFLAWSVLVAIHILAYLRRVPGLLASDWRPQHAPRPPAPGRAKRLAINLAALLAGAIAAVLVLPAFTAWTHW
jgi:hypothetical protein